MPSYLDQVIAAIRSDASHQGTSRQAIAKHLKANGSDNNNALKKALKLGVEKKKLTQTGQRFRVVGDAVKEAPDDGFRTKDIEVGDGAEAKSKVFAGCRAEIQDFVGHASTWMGSWWQGTVT